LIVWAAVNAPVPSITGADATDEHRVLNYLAVRYPTIYARAAQSFAQNFSLSAVDLRSR
jgi:hypothetical protein